ncbi:hypothetical protein E5288_WYG019786 [Bos mutus]|uniref:Uncharacterized protein n=1 Tax=Bos mutus TaxID=72004 RepID=A0A6B0RUW6_9CETA|nr:hypothetical protein [Bos mutus]
MERSRRDKNREDQRQSKSPKVKVISQVTGKGGGQFRSSGAGPALFSNTRPQAIYSSSQHLMMQDSVYTGHVAFSDFS